MTDLVVALDLGTSALKAALFDRRLREVAATTQRLRTSATPDGGSVQDFSQVVRATFAALKRIASSASSPIKGIALTTHRSSLVVFDVAAKRALSPLVLWNDRRATAVVESMSGAAKRAVERRTGLPVLPFFAGPRAAWLLGTRRWPRAAKLLTADSALLLALGSERALTDPSMAARTLLASREGQWDDALLERFGVARDRLATVVPTLGERGRLTRRGLPRNLANVPLVASVADQSAAYLGLAANSTATNALTIGTGLFAARRDGVPDPRRGVMPILFESHGGGDDEHVTRGIEANDPSTGIAFQRFSEWFGCADPQEVDRLVKTARNPALVVPSLVGLGAPWLQPGARGAIFGLTSATTRADILAGMLDGIAARAAELLALLGGKDAVVCGGGGAGSNELLQRIADRSARTLLRTTTDSTTSRGAAMLAWRALGSSMPITPPTSRAVFSPRTEPHERDQLARRFEAAVRCSQLPEQSRQRNPKNGV